MSNAFECLEFCFKVLEMSFYYSFFFAFYDAVVFNFISYMDRIPHVQKMLVFLVSQCHGSIDNSSESVFKTFFSEFAIKFYL